MDFAISNGGDNTVYVFLGNGDGSFKVPEILYTQGQSPDWITAVKLRKNGHLDLAVTDADSSTVEIFPGNGDGTFQASTQTSLPQIPTFVLPTDFNNDGNQDLVVGLTIDFDATQPQFAVLLGDGSGAFSSTLFSPAIYGSPDGPLPTTWVATGDVNNDGYFDIVTTISGDIAIPYLNQAGKSLLMGNPFGPTNGANDGPLVVELGDMDEDGCLDAIETDVYSVINVAKGTCDGNFPTSYGSTPLGDFDPAIKVVDLDGDGHLDVIGSAVYYPNSGGPGYGTPGGFLLSVLKGDGHGNLGLAKVYRGGTSAYSLVVADFNGDGKPDVITAASLEDRASFFINDGTAAYGDPQGETIGYVGGGPINAPNTQAPVEVVDLNGDGKPDLLLVEDGLDIAVPSQLTAVLNDGTGKFLPVVRTPITVGDTIPVPRFIAGAFRSTAAADVIYINTYNGVNSVFNVAFFRGNGDGTFAPPVTLTTLPNPQQIVAGDFNNDGKLDFAVMGTDSTGQKWELDIFLGHGDGTFVQLPAQVFPMLGSDGPQQFLAVDLNHDGKLDLLIALNANSGWVASGDDLIEVLGNGDGTFQAPVTLMSHFGAVAVVDVNRDGYPDLIQNRDPSGDFGQALLYQPGITVYLGSADGTFHPQPSYDLPGVAVPTANPALVGDFNGDGIPDIAVPYWVIQPITLIEPRMVVLQGVGDGTFQVSAQWYQLQSLTQIFIGADFKGDGATDLVDLTGLSSSITTIPAAPAATLDISLDSSPILGSTGTATVSLDLPATSSQTVTLSASDPAIQIPASLHFSAGQQTQNVSFTLGSGFDATHLLALYATLGTQTVVAYGAKANPNLNVEVSAALAYPPDPVSTNVSVEPGETFQMFFGLTSEGGYAGTFSSLTCKGLPVGASCSFDDSAIPILPAGTGTVGFTVTTSTSTPFGTENVTISGSDGFIAPAASFQLGIGDFSLSLSPPTLSSGPVGNAVSTIDSTSTNGLNEQLSFTCTELPAATQCGPENSLSAAGPSASFSVNHNQLAANDYPFQITGTANTVSHTIDAILRVGDYTASLDKLNATLSSGQSAMFNVSLSSINHYATSISFFCQSSGNLLMCTFSPSTATLADSGTTTVQLTVTSPGATSKVGGGNWMFPGGAALFLFSASLCLARCVVVRSKSNLFITFMVAVALSAMLSCGGGGSSSNATGGTGGSGGGGGGGTGGGTSQTLNLTVVAQAVSTQSDTNNQKILGPVVITLN